MNQAFPTAAYPQDWIVGPDGTILYVNNGFEPDEMRFVLERASRLIQTRRSLCPKWIFTTTSAALMPTGLHSDRSHLCRC